MGVRCLRNPLGASRQKAKRGFRLTEPISARAKRQIPTLFRRVVVARLIFAIVFGQLKKHIVKKL